MSPTERLKATKPKAMQNMGSENGNSRSTIGSQATSRISPPVPTSSTM